MKLVLLNDRIPPEGRGGAEAVVWRLAGGLAAAGHDVHIIAATTGRSFEEARAGLRTYHLRARYPERFRAWLSLWNPQVEGALRELLRRIQPAVVNAHNIHSWLTWRALALSREAGAAVVFSGHDAMPFAYGKLTHIARSDAPRSLEPGSYRLPPLYNLRQNRFRYNPLRNAVIRRCLERHAQVRAVPSRALANAWTGNGLPAPEVAPNGIDPAEWAFVDEGAVRELRGRLELEGNRVILIAGRLTREKGVVQALAALDQTREAIPQARLLVLTARELDSQIPATYRHLLPWIRSGGWLDGAELRAAFHLADVVIIPSVCLDVFPTVALEAMASGKPVIATCFGGADEIVIDGETGYIINPFDTAVFADRLTRLLGEERLRREMGERGRERIRDHFTLDRQVERMTGLYQRALSLN